MLNFLFWIIVIAVVIYYVRKYIEKKAYCNTEKKSEKKMDTSGLAYENHVKYEMFMIKAREYLFSKYEDLQAFELWDPLENNPYARTFVEVKLIFKDGSYKREGIFPSDFFRESQDLLNKGELIEGVTAENKWLSEHINQIVSDIEKRLEENKIQPYILNLDCAEIDIDQLTELLKNPQAQPYGWIISKGEGCIIIDYREQAKEKALTESL